MALNDGNHIVNIIDRMPCKKHNAERGFPCYQIPSEFVSLDVIGVCNKRAVLAGANGKISESSYQTKRKEFHRKRAS